jgi:hypothetical protein
VILQESVPHLEYEIYEAISSLEEIAKVITDLTALCPSEEDEWEDEDDDESPTADA